MAIPFTKMHGLGNDFVILDDLGPKPSTPKGELSSDLAKAICDRRFGIGADQILWLRKPHHPAHDIRMEILNADGSVAEMCGNGIRAVALYAHRYGPEQKSVYQVETLAGLKTVHLRGTQVAVDMGAPRLSDLSGEKLEVGGREFQFIEVNVGNPHAVIYVDQVSDFPVEKWGPLIENHPRFPKRTNVEFVEVMSSKKIQVRVWERGAGITLACGTGACASAVASIATGRVHSPVQVYLPGGDLQISWDGTQQGSILMEGPATEVFKGTYYPQL
jgi:diaminopimelate epimerase